VPVAPVVTCSADLAALGAAYLVMEQVEGETIARKILRDAEFAHARTVLTRQWGAALAALHRIPLDVAPDLPATDQVQQYRQALDAFDEPHPAFELAFRWLEANRPPQTEITLVHGDFRLGNCIVGPDGLRAVIDWELAHHGDPMEDLGWLCVKAWRFGSPKPVGGVGEYRELFEAYEAASGIPVDPEVVRWWEVLGTVKWGIMCMMQAHTHLSGISRSHELAAIGRRVCENEHDVLALLP
jgi:aminoglycoside phosphotransferase (APT) family kinase protein